MRVERFRGVRYYVAVRSGVQMGLPVRYYVGTEPDPEERAARSPARAVRPTLV